MNSNKKRKNHNASILSFFNKKPNTSIAYEENAAGSSGSESTQNANFENEHVGSCEIACNNASVNPNDIGNFLNKQVSTHIFHYITYWVVRKIMSFPVWGKKYNFFKYINILYYNIVLYCTLIKY